MGGGVVGGLETVDGCGRLVNVVELEPANLGRDARVVLGISRGRVAVGDVTKWVRRFMGPSCSIPHKISNSDSSGGEPVICDSAQHTTRVA